LDLKYRPQGKELNIIGNLTQYHLQTVRGPGLAYNIPDTHLGGKCYLMDEFEILKGTNDKYAVEFNNFEECVALAKEHMHTPSYAAVAVFDTKDRGIEKFKSPGTLYIKSDIPGKSRNASAEQAGFLKWGVYNKVTFWRSAALADWVESGEPFADMHDGVVELKKD